MMSEAELIEIDNRAARAARELARTNELLRQVLAPVFRDVDRLIEQVRSSNIGRERNASDPHD